MARQRIRIRYSKTGRLKFIGHNDLLRTLEALFRRARLPLAMSGGFHPKVKMSFPGALALGFESTDEVCDLEMDESAAPVDTENLLAGLNRLTLEGLTFHLVRLLNEDEKKVNLTSSVFQMTIPLELRNHTAERVASFLAETSVIVSKTKGRSVDVRSAVVQMIFDEMTDELTIELRTQQGPEAGIREALTALGLEQSLFITLFPKRIRCRLVGETD